MSSVAMSKSPSTPRHLGHEMNPRTHGTPAQSNYERLLTDAMEGDGALFAREDAIEAARVWRNPEPA